MKPLRKSVIRVPPVGQECVSNDELAFVGKKVRNSGEPSQISRHGSPLLLPPHPLPFFFPSLNCDFFIHPHITLVDLYVVALGFIRHEFLYFYNGFQYPNLQVNEMFVSFIHLPILVYTSNI